MKKSIAILCILFLSITKTFALELSESEKQSIVETKSKLWLLKHDKNINWYYNVKSLLEEKIPTLQDEKQVFFLTEFKNEITYIIDSYKPENYDEIFYKEEPKNPETWTESKKAFFDTYGKNIVQKNKLREGCTKYFDFVDEIAQQNNFPTALIIATWSKESNCGLFNPYNGWWPFQITSQYHTPGEITLEEMGDKIQKYIDFSKGKIAYYNSNKKYKQRFWEKNIELSYSKYTLRDLQLYSVLYNGITSSTNIENNKFANGNLNTNIDSDTDGIVTLFLKILNWQIENNK